MNKHLRPIELLLVEDSPTDRLMAIEALNEARIINNLNVVENGVDALAYLRREGRFAKATWPDLILLDLNLPRKDGREVLVEIKNDPLLRYIPVVILTTSDTQEDIVNSYGNHASSFIRKPIDFAQFAKSVRCIGNYWFEIVSLPSEEAIREALCTRPERRPALPAARRKALRVLLVEDSPTDIVLVRELLRGSPIATFDVQTVSRIADLRARNDLASFDVFLTDLGLPDSQGIQTFHQVRSLAAGRPIIILTGLEDEELGLRALREGAFDYLVKRDMTPAGLVRAIRYSVDKQQIEEQLRQSQRVEAVGRLAAGVAHDFNNLLTVIAGQAGLLELAPSLPATAKAALADIGEATARAAALTRQLLTFSRRQVMKTRPIELREILGGIHGMLRGLLGAQISVELQLTADATVVDADIGMLEQLVMNLAVNASDAMPDGGKLTLSTAVVELHSGEVAADAYPGRFVKLTVADSGTGIAPEVLPHIFEPFFTTKEFAHGTGLGLATVHSIVHQHRGWILVHSEPCQGTRFDVLLPVSTASPEAAETSEPVVAGGSETILVVEDEAAVQRTVTAILKRAGYDVLAAASGAEALAVWEERAGRIDLLFTDLTMPGGLGGRQLAETLLERCPRLKVVFTSGYSQEFAASKDILEEQVNFLHKPYSPADLTKIVRLRLDSEQGAPAVPCQ